MNKSKYQNKTYIEKNKRCKQTAFTDQEDLNAAVEMYVFSQDLKESTKGADLTQVLSWDDGLMRLNAV